MLKVVANILDAYTDSNYDKMRLSIGELYNHMLSCSKSNPDLQQSFCDFVKSTDYLHVPLISQIPFCNIYVDLFKSVYNFDMIIKEGLWSVEDNVMIYYTQMFYDLIEVVGYANLMNSNRNATLQDCDNMYKEFSNG